jgi:cobalt transporter subunit CbtA
VPLILQAEVYETAGGESEAAGHVHAAGETAVAADEAEEWAPADGLERTFFTLVANLATSIGFALLLIVASEIAGGMRGWRQGVFWGLAGFAVFLLAPGLGLPPELPAMPAADLAARQIWWIATALATAAALALLVFTRALPLAILAIALLAAPHLIGAPQPASHESPIPESLHHAYVVRVYLTNLVFWPLLGGLIGALRGRFMPAGSTASARA